MLVFPRWSDITNSELYGAAEMDLLTEAAEIFYKKSKLPILPQDDQVGSGEPEDTPIGVSELS